MAETAWTISWALGELLLETDLELFREKQATSYSR